MGTSHQTRMRGFTLTLLATSSLATPHYGRQNLDSDEVDQIMEWQHRYNEALQLENEIRLEQQKESEEDDAQARHGDEDDLARKIGLGVGIQLPFGFGAGLSSGLGNGGFGQRPLHTPSLMSSQVRGLFSSMLKLLLDPLSLLLEAEPACGLLDSELVQVLAWVLWDLEAASVPEVGSWD